MPSTGSGRSAPARPPFAASAVRPSSASARSRRSTRSRRRRGGRPLRARPEPSSRGSKGGRSRYSPSLLDVGDDREADDRLVSDLLRLAGLELNVLQVGYDLEPLQESCHAVLRIGVALNRERG